MVTYHYWGKDSDRLKKHFDRFYDYLWLAEDGMKMQVFFTYVLFNTQGYNGSQLWDTAFALQAIIESGMGTKFEVFC